MSYGSKRPCAACGKPTQVSGFRTKTGQIRFLCQRDWCAIARNNVEIRTNCSVCTVKTLFEDGMCGGCRHPRGRKVSTAVKSASGPQPDSGSIPGSSTDDPEDAVALEDALDSIEGLKSSIEALTEMFTRLTADVKVAVKRIDKLENTVPVPVPKYPDYSWNQNTGTIPGFPPITGF